jgi:hypothetical protein
MLAIGDTPAVERPPEQDASPVERAIVVAWVFAHSAFPLLYLLALATIVLDWSPGGYVLVAGLLATFLTRDLSVGLAYGHDEAFTSLSALGQRLLRLALASSIATYVFVGAALGWKGAAYLAIVALLACFGARVAAGVVSYRDAMRRPWPEVQPVLDDDW